MYHFFFMNFYFLCIFFENILFGSLSTPLNLTNQYVMPHFCRKILCKSYLPNTYRLNNAFNISYGLIINLGKLIGHAYLVRGRNTCHESHLSNANELTDALKNVTIKLTCHKLFVLFKFIIDS